MDPWKSWAIVGVVGIGAAYYYRQSGKSKRGRGRAPPLVLSEQSQRRGSGQCNESKDKRKKKGKSSDTSDQLGSDVADVSSASVQTSNNDTVKKRKGGKKQPSKLAQSSAVDLSPEQGTDVGNEIAEDEGMDNVEFAKQLSGLKVGTSLKKTSTSNENKKTRKQGKPSEATPQVMNGSAIKTTGPANTQDISTASSTTGADADDDLSPAATPDLRATQMSAPSSRDVSDMLETASKGPSILRITEAANPQPARQPKASKIAPEPQSKKQRQNKQKNEEKKMLREQAEKERRTLLEKQLRTAREAEGRPAKNGLGTSQAPSTNAWSKPDNAATKSVEPATKQGSVSLLDTFEETPATAPNPHSTNGAVNGVSVDRNAWNSDLPSEEEQMRMITEMDSDNTWNTVAKGGKSKKKSSPATTAAKGIMMSSKDRTKDTSSVTTKTSATSPINNKTNFKANNKKSSRTMQATSVEQDSTTSSAMENKNTSTGVMTTKEEDLNKTATSPKNDSNNKESVDDKKSADNKEAADDKESAADNKEVADDKESAADYKEAADDKESAADNKEAADDKEAANDKESAVDDASDSEDDDYVPATRETIDHSVWTRENIHEHPDYDPDWPYALTGHPMDDEWEVYPLSGIYPYPPEDGVEPY